MIVEPAPAVAEVGAATAVVIDAVRYWCCCLAAAVAVARSSPKSDIQRHTDEDQWSWVWA